MATSVPKRADKFPLFVHKGRGYWCKTVLGKHFYFGKVADDPQGKKALAEWLRVKDWRLAGLEPPAGEDDLISLKYLCNVYMESREAKRDAGDIAPRTYQENHAVCKLILEVLPGTLDAKLLRPEHFAKLAKEISSRQKSPGTRAKVIGLVRSVFKFAFENDYLEKPVKYGDVFSMPPAKARRVHRNAKGDQSFTPEQVRSLLEHASLNGRAMILLGIQCGMGNTELAELKRDEICGHWLLSARAKTAVMRRVPLWKETLEAIQQSISNGPADGEYVFYKADGRTYHDDARTGWRITNTYEYVAKKAGVEGHSFYDLRRTFSTVAQNMQPSDIDAVESIMGHADDENDMKARYRQNISDERLEAVVKHVRKWLGKLPKGGAK